MNVIVKHVNTGVTAETGSDQDSAVSRDKKMSHHDRDRDIDRDYNRHRDREKDSK